MCRSEGATQDSGILSTQDIAAAVDPIEPVGHALSGVSQVVDFTPGAIPVDSSEEASNQDGSIAEPPIIP